MASSLCDHHLDRSKTPMRSNPSRKVRVVGKIRDFTGPEVEFSSGVSWISVNKPKGEASESVTLSFRDQAASRKESYELDYCYDQYEDNDMIFSREVKPLISGVLGGCNATIIAFGARGSGKTCLIQGSSEKPGLEALAMAEILSVAEKNGSSVTISSYEVYQDHVYDILDPERRVVFVQGDAQGNIRLKGLSQVPVKSISEFYNKLCVSGCGSNKPTQKAATELPRRGHKGLIVHVLSPSENSDTLLVGKLNFVDLAGYEGSRRKSIDSHNLVENSKIHKSIYAMLNVVHALNATENHVPYRESKLTHLLQDSLGGTSRVLMVTCLKPSFCQDSIYMVSLVSRSCQNNNSAAIDSTKKSRSLTRSAMLSSRKAPISKTTFATAKKHTISRVPLSDKKINGSSMASLLKGRKLFDETSQLTKSVKATAISDIASTIKTSIDKEEMSISNVTKATEHIEYDNNPLSDALMSPEHTSVVGKDNLSSNALKHAESTLMAEKDDTSNSDGPTEEFTSSVNSSNRNALSLIEEAHSMEKENKDSQVNGDESPPISARLQDLSNHLKSLISKTPLCTNMPEESKNLKTDCCATPLCIKMPEDNDASSYNYDVEPKTPVINQGMKDRLEVANVNSPWQALSIHNSEAKNFLVQEYLSFLNSASKEELQRLKGIGEKRATYILELRDESPKPFKSLDDLKEIGLSAKQIKGMMKKEVGGLFN